MLLDACAGKGGCDAVHGKNIRSVEGAEDWSSVILWKRDEVSNRSINVKDLGSAG